MFTAEIMEDSFPIVGMAQFGNAPKFLASKAKNGTPRWALVVDTVLVLMMSALPRFDDVLAVANVFNASMLILELAAAMKNRFADEVAERIRSSDSTIFVFQPEEISVLIAETANRVFRGRGWHMENLGPISHTSTITKSSIFDDELIQEIFDLFFDYTL